MKEYVCKQFNVYKAIFYNKTIVYNVIYLVKIALGLIKINVFPVKIVLLC